jgi:hypothetical protein
MISGIGWARPECSRSFRMDVPIRLIQLTGD